MDRNQYEFFAGLNSQGDPRWTTDFAARQPVFQDSSNGVFVTSVSHNPGVNRYFLITAHTKWDKGNIGIYDAPTPWGPWTTVLFESEWGRTNEPINERRTFFWNFSNKWLGSDGTHFALIYTGIGPNSDWTGGNNSWNLVKGSFIVAEDSVAPSTPTGLAIKNVK